MPKFVLTLSLLAGLLLSACEQRKTAKIAVATAANVQFAIEDIVQSFTEQTGIECDIIISSSGKLTAQIREGAPYDVFISADMKYPEVLYRSGQTVAPPKVYALGKLVLWTVREDIQPAVDLLGDQRIRHIAIANPKTAPYGVAATEVLQHYDLYDAVSPKLVYGESISQTNQFIISKTAAVGFTAKSVVLSPKMKDQGQWIEIAENAYSPIEQGAVIIKKNDTNRAQQFYDFLFSDKAKKILTAYGYDVHH